MVRKQAVYPAEISEACDGEFSVERYEQTGAWKVETGARFRAWKLEKLKVRLIDPGVVRLD